MHAVKPLDTGLLDRLSETHSLLVTVEEHFAIGGLGGAVAEWKAGKRNALRQLMLGISNEFRKVGSYAWMLDQCGLTAPKTAQTVAENLALDGDR